MNSTSGDWNLVWNKSQHFPPNMSMESPQQEDFLLGDYNTGQRCDNSLDQIFWVIDAFFGACILAGNSFTIAVFLFGGQLYRSQMNVFLLSLAFSDVLLALVVIPSYAAYCTGCSASLSKLCWFFEGGKDYTFLASVFNVLAISYDRHVAVFRPLLYNLQMTEKRMILILILTWFLPGILAGLRNVWQHLDSAVETERKNAIYTHILFFTFVLIPIITVCVINIRIIHAIKIQLRKIQGTEPKVNSNRTELSSKFDVKHTQETDILRRRRGTISCVLVVVLFVICWLPRGTYILLRLFDKAEFGGLLLVKLSVTFLLFQSSLNPIVYSFFRSEFRQTARRLLTKLTKIICS